MTTAKLKSLFEYYGKFLREKFPGTESMQMSEVCSKMKASELKEHVWQGHLLFMTEEGQRFVDQGRIDKAMRWLGFLQGVLWNEWLFTLDDLKEHSRPRDN